MPKMGYDIICIMYAMLRNLIILCISLSVYSTLTQSAELTLDITSYTYREVDPNDNYFMEDKSATFLDSLDFGTGETLKQLQIQALIGAFYIRLSIVWGMLIIPPQDGKMKKQYYKGRLEYYLSTSSKVGANDLLPYIGLISRSTWW